MQYQRQLRFPPGIRWPVKLATTPGFWLIIATFVLISIPHYQEALKHPAFITDLFSSIGLARHSFERILYLVPIVWSAFLFGRKGAITVSFAALALMLLHAVLLSSTPTDDILEAGAVFVMGNVIAFTVASLHSERKRRAQLEMTQEELHTSEARYRGLFENALDAIWIHDFDGNILAANESAAQLTGYSVENLLRMNVREFLSAESLHLAGTVRYKLLANSPVNQPYEQHLTRKDGSEAIIQLVTGLVRDKGETAGFQHIARDVTEQKRLQENLLLFSRYSTRAHEEERKRITRKIHEETIQDLAVLCRLLDTLDPGRGLPPAESRSSLDELRQQTSRIMQDLRVLGRELRPSGLDHLGLVPVLQWLARNLGEHAGTGLEVNVIGNPRRLPEEVELVLFRITEEAIRNARRHAEASRVEITIEFAESATTVTIRDDGRGSTLPEPLSDLARYGKLGLAGMQERASSVGGRLDARSQPGRGTTITVEVPTQSREHPSKN